MLADGIQPSFFTMHTNKRYRRQALLFHALGSERRLYILELLRRQRYNGVTLAERIGVSYPAISRHLHLLLRAELIDSQRVRGDVFFSASKEKLFQRVRQCAQETF